MVMGDIHLCLLILVFTYVVTNCTVALVEGAFFDTRTAAASDMVRDAKMQAIAVKLTVTELTDTARLVKGWEDGAVR